MGFFSDVFKGAKDAVSDVWKGTKDAVSDVGDVFSDGWDWVEDNTMWGFSTNLMEDLWSGVTGGLLGQQQGAPPPTALSGPLNQPAPSNMTMGTGGSGSAENTVQGPDLSSLFDGSGYSYGPDGSAPLSAQLLQSNPDAYRYNPLFPDNVG